MNNKLIAAVALALPLFAQAASLQNLVVNGGFETNALAAGQWKVFAASSNSGQGTTLPLSGWALDAGPGIELRNAVAGNAFEGAHYVELDSFANASMSQFIDTDAGASYELSFAYSPRAGVSAASNPIAIWWNNELLASLTGPGQGGGNSWQLYSFSVKGSGGFDQLRFASIGVSDSLGGSLDAVSLVQQVPEPASLMLASLGLAGFTLARRRSNSKKA